MMRIRMFRAVALSIWCGLAQAQYFDAETGLHYNNARYYDPKAGRSISADRKSVAKHVQRWQENMGSPVRLPLEINPYVYVANNPLKYIDPSGLDAIVAFYPGGVTHIGIGINTTNTVGLYPKIRKTRVAFCASVPGAVLSDPIFQADVLDRSRTIRIKTTPAQDKRMQFVINRLHEGGVDTPSYNLCGNQCTAFVRQVLEAGEIYAPNDIILPSSLFDNLNDTYGNQNEK
jgi:RHS repeat-associated protein